MTAGLEQLQELGAFQTGHFLTATGQHSDQRLAVARLAEYPGRLATWAETLADRLRGLQVRTVVGPAVGGIIPAYAVARHWAESRVLFTEQAEDGRMHFRRGFSLHPGEAVVVVADTVTTGQRVAAVMDAVWAKGAVVRAVGALVYRGQGPLPWPAEVPLEAVLAVPKAFFWEPGDCPLCRQGMALAPA